MEAMIETLKQQLEESRCQVMVGKCNQYFQTGQDWHNMLEWNNSSPNWHEYTAGEIVNKLDDFIKQIWGRRCVFDLDEINKYSICEISVCDFGSFYKTDDECCECDECDKQEIN